MNVQPKGFKPEDIVLEQDFYLGDGVCVTATCYERSLMDDVQITFWVNNHKEIGTIDVSVSRYDVCENATYEEIVAEMANYIYTNEQAIVEMATANTIERSDVQL